MAAPGKGRIIRQFFGRISRRPGRSYHRCSVSGIPTAHWVRLQRRRFLPRWPQGFGSLRSSARRPRAPVPRRRTVSRRLRNAFHGLVQGPAAFLDFLELLHHAGANFRPAAGAFERIADQFGGLRSGLGAALRQVADLVGDYCKTGAALSGPRRLHRGIQRRDVGLKCDFVNRPNDAGHAWRTASRASVLRRAAPPGWCGPPGRGPVRRRRRWCASHRRPGSARPGSIEDACSVALCASACEEAAIWFDAAVVSLLDAPTACTTLEGAR